MGFGAVRTECYPEIADLSEGNRIDYVIDLNRKVELKLLNYDGEKGTVECPLFDAKGLCDGKFPCGVNQIDPLNHFTKVVGIERG